MLSVWVLVIIFFFERSEGSLKKVTKINSHLKEENKVQFTWINECIITSILLY